MWIAMTLQAALPSATATAAADDLAMWAAAASAGAGGSVPLPRSAFAPQQPSSVAAAAARILGPAVGADLYEMSNSASRHESLASFKSMLAVGAVLGIEWSRGGAAAPFLLWALFPLSIAQTALGAPAHAQWALAAVVTQSILMWVRPCHAHTAAAIAGLGWSAFLLRAAGPTARMAYLPTLVPVAATACAGLLTAQTRLRIRRIGAIAGYGAGVAALAAALSWSNTAVATVSALITAVVRNAIGAMWRLPIHAPWHLGSIVPLTATHAFNDQLFPVGALLYGAAWAVSVTAVASPRARTEHVGVIFAVSILACAVLCSPEATCLHPFIGLLLLLRDFKSSSGLEGVAASSGAAAGSGKLRLEAARRHGLGVVLGPVMALLGLHFATVFEHAWAVLRAAQLNMAYYGLLLASLCAFGAVEWRVRCLHATMELSASAAG
jgi:hypothetical protein